jgi:hypothetical protein
VVFTEAFDGARHKIVGNLVGSGDATIGNYTDITGRVLGFQKLYSFTNDTSIPPEKNKSSIKAIVSTKEPLLEPVLQIHSSDGTPAATLNRGRTNIYDNYWMQQASSTYYNAAFVANNSPDRPQEYAAGLNNYVRFEENWCGSATDCGASPQFTVGIKGSFIQLQRSSFATGPFVSYLPSTPVPIHIFGEDTPTLDATKWDRYPADNSSSPYYIAGLRNWGFDIGLLSQAPDLFSSRFTVPVFKKQNYYRQVARDDDWVKVLLCAAEPSDPNADITVGTQTIKAAKGPTGTAYPDYALPASDRPSGCPTSIPNN